MQLEWRGIGLAIGEEGIAPNPGRMAQYVVQYILRFKEVFITVRVAPRSLINHTDPFNLHTHVEYILR
jgi:hypothetical protein